MYYKPACVLFDFFLPPFLLHQSSLWREAFQLFTKSLAALSFPSKRLLLAHQFHFFSYKLECHPVTGLASLGHLNLGERKRADSSLSTQAALWQQSQQCSWQSSRWSLTWSREITSGHCSSGCWCSHSIAKLLQRVPNLHTLGWFSETITNITILLCTSHFKIINMSAYSNIINYLKDKGACSTR